jgi:predicted component of type VI protein secretion system
MAQKLARVRWQTGQILRPADFTRLESSLSAEAEIRASLSGLPAYGLLRLSIDGDELQNGVFRVDELVAVLRTGQVIDTNDNAARPADLHLRDKGREAQVYLHVHDPPRSPPGAGWDSEEEEPHRLVLETSLSTEASRPDASGLPLGAVERTMAKRSPADREEKVGFRLSTARIPPLLRLRSTPHLGRALWELYTALDETEKKLAGHVAQARQRGAAAGALQRARAEIRKACLVLGDAVFHEGEQYARLHPYFVHDALRVLFLELCFLEGELPAEVLSPADQQDPLVVYNHDDLGGCLGGLVARLLRQIHKVPRAAPTIELRKEGEAFIGRDLPPALLGAEEVYLIIQKPQPYAVAPLEGARLVALKNLGRASTRTTRGLIPQPPEPCEPRADLGIHADWYKLQIRDERGQEAVEWKDVREEGAIGFRDRPELAGIGAFLYWRGHEGVRFA